MAIVYMITNNVNGKKYVGVTQYSLDKRFKEHCHDSKTDRCKNRLLYSDMNKYGFENFSIDELEVCSDDKRFERETYWIDKLDTHNNGYNLTYGGSGKQFYNYEEIANKYLELKTVKDVCDFYNCDPLTVRIACKEYNVNIMSTAEYNKKHQSKPVIMLEIETDKPLKTFYSCSAAGRWLGNENKCRHITDVCNGIRNKAYGYKWMWLEDYQHNINA